jgi:hypothetical protein
LSDLAPTVLAPGVLPGLWTKETITVGDVIGFFAGGRTIMVQREGYEEPVIIPSCPAQIVEGAIAEAVRQGSLWLVNGPASFQGEEVPAGVLTASAHLRSPMLPLTVDQLTQDAAPEAWKNEETTALALSVALSQGLGHPVPWMVLRRAIDDALKAAWLERSPASGPWPCDFAGAAAVLLRQPKRSVEGSEPRPSGYRGKPGSYSSAAVMDASALQDLVEALPELVKTAAGLPLEFQLNVSIGGEGHDPAVITAINKILAEVSPDLLLKPAFSLSA